MNYEKYFGERIKSLRISQNLSQEELGKIIGLTKQAISDIERGRRSTTVYKAIAIAQCLNTTVEYLCGVVDNPSRII